LIAAAVTYKPRSSGRGMGSGTDVRRETIPGSEACWQGVRPSCSGRCEGDGKKKEERGQGGVNLVSHPNWRALSNKQPHDVEVRMHGCKGCSEWRRRRGRRMSGWWQGVQSTKEEEDEREVVVAMVCTSGVQGSLAAVVSRSDVGAPVEAYVTRLRGCRHTSHVTRHTSHVTRHTSHVTRHTSHVTRHTSHVTRHTSHVTRHTSHVTRHTSHVTRHTSHVTRHTSHVTRHTSHVTRHTSHVTRHRFTTNKSSIF
jgi:hypothetical protein